MNAALVYPPVRIGIKAAEDDLVLVRFEDGSVRNVTLGDFVDAHIQDMTDADVDALYAGDNVALELRVMGPCRVQVIR